MKLSKVKIALFVVVCGSLLLSAPASAQALNKITTFPSRKHERTQDTRNKPRKAQKPQKQENVIDGDLFNSHPQNNAKPDNKNNEFQPLEQNDENTGSNINRNKPLKGKTDLYNEAKAELAKGTPEGREKARELFEKAAIMGSPEAMNELGFMYGNDPVPQSDMALQWFLKAANAGDPAGMYNAGYCYSNGFGTVERETEIINGKRVHNVLRQDFEMPDSAFYWYNKGAKRGDIDCKQELAKCYINNYGVPEELKKNDVRRYELALGLLEDVFEQYPDNPEVQYLYGRALYENGNGYKGIAQIRKAADAGNSEALKFMEEFSQHNNADSKPNIEQQVVIPDENQPENGEPNDDSGEKGEKGEKPDKDNSGSSSNNNE